MLEQMARGLVFVVTFRHLKISDMSKLEVRPVDAVDGSFAVNQRSQIPADVTETPSLHDTTHNGTKCGCDPGLSSACAAASLFQRMTEIKQGTQKYFL